MTKFKIQNKLKYLNDKIQNKKSFDICHLCFVIILSFVLCYLNFVQCAFASIEVDPLRLEIEADTSKTVTGYVTLTNHGNEDLDISVSQGEYRYMFSNDAVYPAESEQKPIPSCKNWINFKPDKIKLENNKSQQFQYTITIPHGSAGEYVASILLDEERQTPVVQTDKTGQIKIKITPRINIPLYIMIKNTSKRKCEISGMTVTPAGLKCKKISEISFVLKNTGAVHIRPVTNVVLFDENGAIAGKVNLGRSLPIFPGFGENLTAKCPVNNPGGYTAVATVDIGAEALTQQKIKFEVK